MTAHTFNHPQWTTAELIAAKADRRVSVVLPALNEAETVAAVIATVMPLVGALVDELVVLDSGSTDATAEVARAAGATVISREQALPEIEPVPGKGEVLWRSLAATSGGFVVFLDADLVHPDPEFVPRLLGPLLTDDAIALVKGFYRRPLHNGESVDSDGGGRVTELVARPLLSALRPELSSVVQPLSGEYAGRRDFFMSVPFAAGYGVEIGLLLDAYDRLGISAIAQVNLGTRVHRNRDLADLGVMSRQIIGTALERSGIKDSGAALTQYPFVSEAFVPRSTHVSIVDRPPMNTLRT